MVNHPVVYSVFQGIFRTGAAAVPVMFQLTTPELRYILEDTGAHALITDTANLEKAREAIAGLPGMKWMAVLGGSEDSSRELPEYSLEELLESEPELELVTIADDDLALLLYTSGTTGKPKGAMLSHANLIASAEASTEASEPQLVQGPGVTVSAMPMAHIFGVAVMNGGYLVPERLADGYTVQMSWFEPERMMQLIEEHKATRIPAVPTMLALILNHPKVDEYDLSSLEEVVCGAAPLPVELANAFAERYGCRVREVYGMTESTGLGSANRLSDSYRPGSAGRAYGNTELRIVDEDGRQMPAGEAGEVALRGPSVMLGYLNRPEATAEAIRDGWLHTGDVGYLDEDGFLFIVDRKKDMIIRGGENIYPAELESVLYEHPSVAEAAVVGAPDPVYGERVVAYVVKKQGEEVDEAELIGFVKNRTTSFKTPSAVRFLKALPKSGVGKILRRELRELAAEEEAAAGTSLLGH